MKPTTKNEARLRDLDRGLRTSGLAAVAIALILFAMAAFSYFFWPRYYVVGGPGAVEESYHEALHGLKVVICLFPPLMGSVLLIVGLQILYYLHHRKNLDKHEA